MSIGPIGPVGGAGGYFAVSPINQVERLIMQSMRKLSENKRVTTPADDPAAFMTLTKLRVQMSGHMAAQEGITQAQGMMSVAQGGLTQVNDIVGQLKTLAQKFNEGLEDKTQLQTHAALLEDQLSSALSQTRFGDKNLISGTSATTASLQLGPNATDAVTVSNPQLQNTIGTTVSDFVSASHSSTIDLTEFDAIIDAVGQAQGNFAAMESRLTYAASFNDKMVDSLSEGVRRIEHLDVAKETANLTSLQIKRDMGMAMLAQANMDQRNVMGLLLGSLR